MKQQLIQKDLKALNVYSLQNVENRHLYESVQQLSPLLCFLCLLVQEQQLCLQRCSSRLGMDLKLILHRTITKSGNKSLVIWSSFYNDSFLMCWHVSNVSFTPLYKGVKTCCLETQDSFNNLQVPKLCWICFTSKFT